MPNLSSAADTRPARARGWWLLVAAAALGLLLISALVWRGQTRLPAAAAPTAIDAATATAEVDKATATSEVDTATATAKVDKANAQLSASGLYRASFTLAEPEVPINKLHTWTLHVETPEGEPIDGATILVDGDMPEHGHGLPTRPQVTQALGNGDYLVEGMKFQMGGWWVVDFDITVNGQTDQVSFDLMLP